MKKIILSIILSAVFLIIFAACKKDFLDTPDPNTTSSADFYKTDADFTAAINATYGSLQRGSLFGREIYPVIDLVTDEIEATPKSDANAQVPIDNFTTFPNNDLVTHVWTDFYIVIFRANLVLDNIKGTPLQNRIKGEALFIRSLAYYYLTSLYGDVPLILTSDAKKNISPTREKMNVIFDQLEKDLLQAKDLLPINYSPAETGRATSGAVNGLLGIIYMLEKKYDKAEPVFANIISSGTYDLVPNFRDNGNSLNENNKESLFEVQFSDQTGGNANWCEYCGDEGSFYQAYYGSAIFGDFWNFKPSVWILNQFEPNDPRKMASIFGQGSLSNNGKPYSKSIDSVAVRKYVQDTPEKYFAVDPINIRVLRFSDILLLYAEALNENGKTAQAAVPINRVRTRATADKTILPDVSSALSQGDMFNAIVHERIVELCFEQKRWIDLVRWDRAGKINMIDVLNTNINKAAKASVKNKLFPIPQGERDTNPLLVQNPGY